MVCAHFTVQLVVHIALPELGSLAAAVLSSFGLLALDSDAGVGAVAVEEGLALLPVHHGTRYLGGSR